MRERSILTGRKVQVRKGKGKKGKGGKDLTQGLSALTLLTLETGLLFGGGTIPCIIGYLAKVLVSAYQVPLAHRSSKL